MSWLQNRPSVSDSVQLYSTSLGKTMLIVGLGNPGAEYDLTRHNVGFACVEAFVAANQADMQSWILKKDLKCQLASGRFGDSRVLAIKPTTFMNLSGEAVQAVCAFYKISPENVIVLHDELDIDFGHIRLRVGGSSAGHNGIKSVTQHCGENYSRVRIGIGPKQPAQIDSADFVLQKFTTEEQTHLSALRRETTAILSEYIYGGQLPQETRSFII